MTTEHGGIGNWHQLIPLRRAVGCNGGRLRMESIGRVGGARNACPASGTLTGRASFAGEHVAARWCAALQRCVVGWYGRTGGQEDAVDAGFARNWWPTA